MKMRILAAAFAGAALVVAGCGSDDSASAKAGSNATDWAFVADMVSHHKFAIEMATIAQEPGKSPFVKTCRRTSSAPRTRRSRR